MALRLEDVGKIASVVLRKMAELKSARFNDLDGDGITTTQAKNAFARLESMGLMQSPTEFRGPWKITAKGLALVTMKPDPEPDPESQQEPEPEPEPQQEPQQEPEPQPQPQPEPEPQPEPQPEPEPEPEPQPEPQPQPQPEPEPQPEPQPQPQPEPQTMRITNQQAAEIMAAMEFQTALDHVRARLSVHQIPARAAYTYWQILEVLPKPLVDALMPITQLVDE